MNRSTGSDNRGFTLIEALITSLTVIIVGIIIIYALASGINRYAKSAKNENTLMSVMLALTRMEKDIRSISAPEDIDTAKSIELAFRDPANRNIVYSYDNRTVFINGYPLVSGVRSFKFIYKDVQGGIIARTAVAPVPADIRCIEVVMETKIGGDDQVFHTAVSPRAFRD
ncbi:hypothetical protein ACFLQ8_01230 [Candidatus Auribacterota bacterium]